MHEEALSRVYRTPVAGSVSTRSEAGEGDLCRDFVVRCVNLYTSSSAGYEVVLSEIEKHYPLLGLSVLAGAQCSQTVVAQRLIREATPE